MDRTTTDAVDLQLGEWLREESATRAPSGLIEDVFTRTAQTGQVRRSWVALPNRWTWRGPAIAAAAALILVVVVGLTFRPGVTGPGVGSSPSPSASLAPSATPSAATPRAPTPNPVTPAPTVLGTSAAQRLDLGVNAGPIDVTEAFGSIWVADIHADDVRRYEPGTMREIARIPTEGPGWFAVADGALWVSNQLGAGVSRIDPATNTVTAHIGDAPPCGAPILASGILWQAACDRTNVFLKFDPVTNTLLERVPALGHAFLVQAGGRLLTTSPDGLSTFDPATGGFTPIANPAAVGVEFITSDGATVWLKNRVAMVRIDPSTGRTIGTIPETGAVATAFAGDHAWVTVTGKGALEVDLATTTVTRTIPILPSAQIPFEAGDGVLWISDFDGSALWRIEP